MADHKKPRRPRKAVPSVFHRRRRRRSARRWPFAIVCLTGSIAMGKSTAAAMLKRMGWPVFDADAAVHALMKPGGAAIAPITAVFGDVLGPQGVDRGLLGQKVFGNPSALRQLEAIIHPMVGLARQHFLQQAALQRREAVVIDVPLLFETGGEHSCDFVVVVSAPAFLQRQRALARSGMTAAKFAAILAQQTADHVKRHQAFVIARSGLGKRETLRDLASLRKVVRAVSQPQESGDKGI
jgi:dephospho-CoA kinase